MLPRVVFAVSLWGVGLGGGWWLAVGLSLGAPGFWMAAIAALALASAGLAILFERTTRDAVRAAASGSAQA